MMDVPRITTGSTAINRTLGRVGLAAAVLLATVVVGAGSAVAAPAGAAPAMDAPNETLGPAPGVSPAFAPSRPIHDADDDLTVASEEGLQMEVQAVTEEHPGDKRWVGTGGFIVEVRFPRDTLHPDAGTPFNQIFLGHADQFESSEDGDAVSLPEDTDGLATPVEVERLDERTYRMYFRTEDLATSNLADFSGSDYIEVGLAVSADGERTVGGDSWITDTVYINVKPRDW